MIFMAVYVVLGVLHLTPEVKIYPPDTTVTTTPMEFEDNYNLLKTKFKLWIFGLLDFFSQAIFISLRKSQEDIPTKNDHYFAIYSRITNPPIKSTQVKE